jgi:4-amino-4-deoxy-L-arabinose transferase-like glycosyltransferase
MQKPSQILLLILVGHAIALAWIAKAKSPVADEVAHLPAGISHWVLGRFDLYDVNPPLPRMIGALPVLLMQPKLDWSGYRGGAGSRSEFSIGEDFVRNNGVRSEPMFLVARLMMIPFSLLGAFFCYRWGLELFGEGAGLVACLLWCSCPNVLGNASLLMPDIPCAAMGIAAMYYFWAWNNQRTWKMAFVAGVFLGGALLCKSSNLLLIPCFGVFMTVRWWSRRQSGDKTWVAPRQFCALIFTGLICLNLGYGFDGTCRPLGSFEFVSRNLGGSQLAAKSQTRESGNRFRETTLGSIPVPFPQNFILGIDKQAYDLQGLEWGNYLRGEFAKKGWWYYYIYGMLVKYPLGIWLLLGLSLFAGWGQTNERKDAIAILLGTGLVFLLVVSANTGFSHHMRYLLAIVPMIFVLSSGAMAWTSKFRASTSPAWKGYLSLIAVSWFSLSSLFTFPHSMSYFNEMVGGPLNGHQHMLYSNLDWGQDLYYLRTWLAEHPEVDDLQLAYFGGVQPKDFGVRHRIPPMRILGNMSRPLTKGWYVVSANYYHGFQWYFNDDEGFSVFTDQDTFTYFQSRQPKRTFGYSLFLFRIDE